MACIQTSSLVVNSVNGCQVWATLTFPSVTAVQAAGTPSRSLQNTVLRQRADAICVDSIVVDPKYPTLHAN